MTATTAVIRCYGIRPTSPREAVERARQALRMGIRYQLANGGGGGRNPRAPTPAGPGGAVDCVGFTCWCSGFDRYQVDFEVGGYKGWVNTDSAILDADGPRVLFEPADLPRPGDWLVYGSHRENGKRVPGHVSLIVEVPADWQPGELFGRLRVIDCSYSRGGVAERSGALWNARGRVLRYRHYVTTAS